MVHAFHGLYLMKPKDCTVVLLIVPIGGKMPPRLKAPVAISLSLKNMSVGGRGWGSHVYRILLGTDGT